MGELAGLGRILPNPNLFIRPFLRREAVSSTRIEGTRSDLKAFYLFEGAQLPLPVMEPSPPEEADLREVYNYVRALEYGLAQLEFLETHPGVKLYFLTEKCNLVGANCTLVKFEV